LINVDEIPIDITTEPEEDGGDDESTHVHVGIVTDDHHFGGSANAYADVTPDELAGLIVRAALGAAAAHGTDTWIALQQLLAPAPPRSST
jgi:hypothetical protein